MSYVFTRHYSARTIKNIEKHCREKLLPNCDVLEIGVFEARTSCYLIDNYNGIKWTGVDNFVSWRHQKDVVKNRAISNLNNRGNLIISDSFSAMNSIVKIGKKFDFIYIDGDHQPQSVFADCFLAEKLLKDDGLMLLDDIGHKDYPLLPEVVIYLKEIWGDYMKEVFSDTQQVLFRKC